MAATEDSLKQKIAQLQANLDQSQSEFDAQLSSMQDQLQNKAPHSTQTSPLSTQKSSPISTNLPSKLPSPELTPQNPHPSLKTSLPLPEVSPSQKLILLEQFEFRLDHNSSRRLPPILQGTLKRMQESVLAQKKPIIAQTIATRAFEIDTNEKFFEGLFESVKNNFLGDFEGRLERVESEGELRATLVDEVDRSRRCMEELVLGIEDLLKNLLEKELWGRYQEEGKEEYRLGVMRLRSVLGDPGFREYGEIYRAVALKQIREEGAKRKILSWVKVRRQGLRLKNLENKHRSQYELFQAGSGKYLLQLLMQKIEDNAFCVYNHLRPEIDVEFERRRKTAFAKLK